MRFSFKQGYPKWRLIWDTILPLEIAAHMQPKVPIIDLTFFPKKSAKRDAICFCSTRPQWASVMVRHGTFDHVATFDRDVWRPPWQSNLVPVRSVPLVSLNFLPTKGPSSKFHKGLGAVSDGCRRCHIRDLCPEFYDDAGTPVVQSPVPSVPNWVWSWNIFKRIQEECQNVVGSEVEPHQKKFLSNGATFEFTGWETRVDAPDASDHANLICLLRKLQPNWRTSSTKRSRIVLSRLQRRPQVKLRAMKFSSMTGCQHFNPPKLCIRLTWLPFLEFGW